MDGIQLKKHSDTLEQRKAVEEFLDWLNEEEILLGSYIKFKDYAERMAPILLNRQELLDQYFGIDPAKLDQERRALLEKAKEASK